MPTRPASFLTLLALFFFLAAPAPLTAQVRPDQFDILGFKLGIPGGPELKEKIEALPDNYKCSKTMDGYSCDSWQGYEIKKTLNINFDVNSGNKVWLISLTEPDIKNGPTFEIMKEALSKKYGHLSLEQHQNTFRWRFDRKGNILKHDDLINELCGVTLFAAILPPSYDQVNFFSLTLSDCREQYERKVKEEQQKKAIPAPSF